MLVDKPSQDRPAPDSLARVDGGMISAWRNKSKRSMGPLPVVVGAIPGEDGPQVTFAEDQDAVGELGSDGQHESSAKQFALGQRGGIMMVSIPAPTRTASKGGGELAGAVPDEEPEPGGVFVEVHQQLRCGRRAP